MKTKQGFKLTSILIGVVIILSMGAGGAYIVQDTREKNSDIIIPADNINDETTDWGTYKNNELGIQFKHPIEWGDISIKNTFSGIQIKKEIIFTKEERIKLITATPNFSYPAIFDREFIRLKPYYGSSCSDDYISYPNFTHTENCENPPYTNIAKIVSTQEKTILSEKDNASETEAVFKLSKNYYIKLNNPIYNILNIVIDADKKIAVKDYCEKIINVAKQSVIYPCFTENEKGRIKDEFRALKTDEFLISTEKFIKNMEIKDDVSAKKIYENHFSEKSTFLDTKIGFSFNYPAVFGKYYFDKKSNTITYPHEGNNEIFYIKITSAEDAAQNTENFQECNEGFCSTMAYYPTLQEWEGSKRTLLTETPHENIGCEDKSECIVQIGENKMIKRFYKVAPEPDVETEYIFYINDNRLDIYVDSNINTPYISEYQDMEKEEMNFNLKIVKDILNSIKVIK